MNNTEVPTQESNEVQQNNSAEEAGRGRERFLPCERRSIVNSTRRDTETRHEYEAHIDGEEKRAELERRFTEDRRKKIFCISSKTKGSVSNIEDWLDENCEQEWSVVLEDIDDALLQKSLRIMFKSNSDRELFFTRYIKGQG